MQVLPLLVFFISAVYSKPTRAPPHVDCNSQCDKAHSEDKEEVTDVHENGHYNGFSLISRDAEQPVFSYLANSGDHFCGSVLLNLGDIFVRVVNVSESRVGKNYPIEKVIKKEQLALLKFKESITDISNIKVAGNSTTSPEECVMAVTIEYSGLENGPIQPMEFLDNGECLVKFNKKYKLCTRSVETRWRQKGRIEHGCPLLCKNSEEPMLVGIQLESDEDSNIDAFIDVRKYKPWIEIILQQ